MCLRRQFMHFVLVGALGTGVQYIVLWLGVEHLGLAAATASGLGYILGSVVNYLLNYFFTFSCDKSHLEAARKYYTVVGIGWLINTGLMALLVNELDWNYWLAQIVTTAIGLLWNFGGSRWWVFR